MRFLYWLFSFTSRHRIDINRYEKGKVATRIFVSIVELVLLIGTLSLELWCINLFNTQLLLGILVLIFLLVPLALTSLDTFVLYIYLGFKSFASKKIDEVIDNLEHSEKEAVKKSNRWLDLFVGILSILCLGLLIFGIFFVTQI